MDEPVDAQAEHAAPTEVETADDKALAEEKSQQHAESGGDTVAAAVAHGDTSTGEAAAAAQQPSAEAVQTAEETTTKHRTSFHSAEHELQEAADSASEHKQQQDVQSAEQEQEQSGALAAAETPVEHDKVEKQEPEHPAQQQDDHQAAAQGRQSEGAAADEPHAPAAKADHPKPASGRSSSSGGAEAPVKHTESPKKSVSGANGASAHPAAADAPQHAREHEAAADNHNKSPKGQHKQTAVERLTTPTAMRMLKTLQQTQGSKDEWHIATGVSFKSKKLSPDEMSAMVDRLCTPKHESDNLPPKPHAVKLVFEGNKEVLVPVKETSKDDNIAYMANLYERCQETRAKTKQTLQEKWLKPLIQPKQASTPAK